ncbi:Retrovirus-related Pol polyprotein from transposon TNT 1-94-like protein [Drosera capensis]
MKKSNGKPIRGHLNDFNTLSSPLESNVIAFADEVLALGMLATNSNGGDTLKFEDVTSVRTNEETQKKNSSSSDATYGVLSTEEHGRSSNKGTNKGRGCSESRDVRKNASFSKGTHAPKARKLELVHTDVWGPSKENSLSGANYYVTFIDDSIRKLWVYFLKNKSDMFDEFKKWKSFMDNQTDYPRRLELKRRAHGSLGRDVGQRYATKDPLVRYVAGSQRAQQGLIRLDFSFSFVADNFYVSGFQEVGGGERFNGSPHSLKFREVVFLNYFKFGFKESKLGVIDVYGLIKILLSVYYNTYNIGWKDHQNFSWNNQAARQQPPRFVPQEKKSNLEELMTKFISTSEFRFNNVEAPEHITQDPVEACVVNSNRCDFDKEGIKDAVQSLEKISQFQRNFRRKNNTLENGDLHRQRMEHCKRLHSITRARVLSMTQSSYRL